MRIYLDLDGVLTDFDKQLSKLLGRPTTMDKEGNDPKTWGAITRAGTKFWATMDWMPGGDMLWQEIKKYEPIVLTAPSNHKSSYEGKKEWLKKNLPGVPFIIEQDKYKYASPESILIDDREKNINKWEKSGGIGILHKSAPKTLIKLAEIIQEWGKKQAVTQSESVYVFNLPKLPYASGALQPFLSSSQVLTHYLDHHAKYLEKLNKALVEKKKEYFSLPEIIKNPINQDVYNNASQVWNHNFFWKSLNSTSTPMAPSGKTMQLINDSFDGYENFMMEFKKKCLEHFGSGWGWLSLNKNKLEIMTTEDGDTLFSQSDAMSILCVDLWEHAYYLDYQSDRGAYLEAVLKNLLNWDYAEELLTQFSFDG